MKNVFLLMVSLVLLSAMVWADATLPVPLKGQEKNNWCWDASSQMVLEYNQYTVSQTSIAAWAVAGINRGNSLDANGVNFTWTDGKTYKKYGCKQVLKHFGPVYSTFLGRALTKDEIETEMDNFRPAILGVYWKKVVGGNTKTVGGHAIVLSGKSGDKVTLKDPWPADNNPSPGKAGVTYLVDYTALFNAPGSGTYSSPGSATLGNTWGQTLKTGRAMDLCFLIDSTGSMADDIHSVKNAASSLINGLSTNYKDLRIAVVDYRDYPVNPYGDPGDYITKVRLAFDGESNTPPAQAIAAIQSIAVNGGNDWPEAVYSAVMRTLSGTEIGAWREEAERYIILMGDAPGHNPEPWDGGNSFAGVIAYALGMEHPVAVYALTIGTDTAAAADLGSLAAATGGGSYDANNASEVVPKIEEMVEDFTEDSRAPKGDVASFKPMFSFELPKETMYPEPKKYFLEIQLFNDKKTQWKKYKKFKIQSNVAKNYSLQKSLRIGKYRWRLGYKRNNGIFTLPSGESKKVKGGKFFEGNWTEFNRVEVTPQAPDLLEPNYSFTAADKKVTYRIGTAVNADKYIVEIYKTGETKPWKKFNLKAKKGKDTTAALEKAIAGHKVGDSYYWRVQSLNADRRKPVDGGWVTYGPVKPTRAFGQQPKRIAGLARALIFTIYSDIIILI